jgi:hypothetical protein
MPLQKLHFVEHPRYGSVYPFVTLDKSKQYPKTSIISTIGLTCFNTSILYSTFIMPIYIASFSAIFANPIFLLPSLTANYILWRHSSVYLLGERSEVVNMFLKPNGKQIIVETKDGLSKTINTVDIYEAKAIETKYAPRIDFFYGANEHRFIRGNSHIYDAWVLTKVLEKTFIDTRNCDSDFDMTKEFTWEFKDLVEIKKRKRVVDRVITPTSSSFTKLMSSAKRRQAIKMNSLVTTKEPFQNYKTYELFVETHPDDKAEADKQLAQYKLNLTNAGRPLIPKR